MYWDDSCLEVVPYNRKQKLYHCGRQLLKPKTNKIIKYIILVIDLHEAYCANIYSDGEIEKIFNINSTIMNKQKQGGQSQRRFERLREGSITEWFKRINEYLKEIEGNIYVGINFVYKERFRKHLSTENKNKIIEFGKTEYSGLSGIYQYKSRLEKNNY